MVASRILYVSNSRGGYLVHQADAPMDDEGGQILEIRSANGQEAVDAVAQTMIGQRFVKDDVGGASWIPSTVRRYSNGDCTASLHDPSEFAN